MSGRKTRARRWMLMAEDLIENNTYTNLKKAAKDRNI